mgnify:CR=1 FL=1
MRRNDTCHREPHIYFNCRSDGEPYQEQTARHADLLGVYGGVTNQEIADYLKTHDR